MEVKYIRFIVALLSVLFQCANVLAGADDWREELILEGVKKLDALIAQNKANEEAGRSHLNSYVVNLDGGRSQKGDFIEERGEGPNGKFTLLRPDELTLLDNDLKSFHARYSPKKEVGVYVILVNNFQLLIRNQLPGNPEVQKLSDFAYYIDKDKQDQIKDLTKQMKGIVREVIDRTKNKGYTKQTYGILYGVISTYDLNSPDLTTGIVQDLLEPVSYLSVFMDKSAATSMESYGIINREMPKGKDLVRSHAAVYPRLEALIKGFEKGYLKSRAIASLEEEAVALGIKEGPGRTLFMNLPKEKTLTNEEKAAFGELCKYLNTETSGKTFAFYHPGLPNEIGQNGKDLYEQTWEYIYEKDLLTKEKFDKHFFKNSCRDINLIFADVDLWEGIDRDAYNKNSPDYVSPGRLYEYSFADFKVREGHKNTSLFGVIQALEEAGKAEPLSTSGHYDQYFAKWKTDAAYIFIANWSAHWSKDILEAYIAQYVAASGVLSTKALKDAAIGSMVDYTLQIGLNWAFFAKDDATIEEIAKDVDFYQIAASGAENAFSSSLSNPRTQILLGAGISCMFDGSFEDGNLRRDFNLEECAKGIASAVIANQISNFALVRLQNLDAERLKRGLLRLGIPQKEWTRFLRWLGIKNADHIAEGVEKSLEELLSGLKKVVPSHQWDKFVDDFGKDAAKLAKFDADPKLVDSWKALGEFPSLRKIPSNLEVLDKVKGKFTYNGKVGQEALEEIFTGHKSAQKFIDNFKKYDEIIGSIDDITVTGIKSSSEVKILNKGSQVGKVVDGKLNVNYSGFGGDIVCDPNRTTTLIGKWAGGTEDLWKSGIARQLDDAVGPPGGINILGNVDMSPSPSAIWQGQNKPWLDAAIKRGDVVRAVSDPIDIKHVFYDPKFIPNDVFSSPEKLATYLKSLSDAAPEVNQLSFYGREIRHLYQNGYTYNSSLKVFAK